jgi:hypothetical protein
MLSQSGCPTPADSLAASNSWDSVSRDNVSWDSVRRTIGLMVLQGVSAAANLPASISSLAAPTASTAAVQPSTFDRAQLPALTRAQDEQANSTHHTGDVRTRAFESHEQLTSDRQISANGEPFFFEYVNAVQELGNPHPLLLDRDGLTKAVGELKIFIVAPHRGITWCKCGANRV